MAKKPNKPLRKHEWIADRLRVIGRKKGELAEAMGLPPSRITEIIKGDERQVQLRELLPLAVCLKMPLQEALVRLIGLNMKGVNLGVINVVGKAEAGVPVPTPERPSKEWYASAVSPLPEHSDLPQFGLEVEGSHANLLYPHGSVVVCVRFVDLGRPPRPGDRVIVHRPMGDGTEVSIKELKADTDGTLWLWPASTDPRHQQPVRPDEIGLEIVARIIGSYRREPD